MLLLLFSTAFLAFGLSAVAGGGASLLVIPLLQQFVAIESVPAALSIGTGASSLSRIAAFRHDISWDVSAWFVPAAVPMALAGAALLRFVNPIYIQIMMAAFLLSNLPLVFRRGTVTETRPLSRAALVAVGGTAGFLSGLTGAVGVLFNRFYLSHGLSKQEIVATRAANEVLIHVTKLLAYGAMGLLTRQALGAGLCIALAAAASSVALRSLLPRLPHRTFATLGYVAMVISGLTLFGDSLGRLVEQDRIHFSYAPIVHGVDGKLQWRDSALAVEIVYDEGVEVELGIPLSALNAVQRRLVDASAPEGSTPFAEAVYELGRRYYEVYYVVDGRAVEQIAFDDAGRLLSEDELP